MPIIRNARSEDAAAIARVHVEGWRTTYRGLVPDATLDGLSVAERTAFWTDRLDCAGPECFHVVAVGESGEVIGYADGGPERTGDFDYDGETYSTYILPAERGRGVGRRLIAAAAAALRDRRLDGMLVWVLDGNPYRGFYERLGGETCGRRTIEIGGRELVELAYGWRDLSSLDVL